MRPDEESAVAVGLVGAGIGESLSPALHEREAELLGIDYSYTLLDLDELGRPASDVGDVVREARRDGLLGLNVTHPCKQLVVPELDGLSPEAAALGAVNTIVFGDAGLVGHNTDSTGFQEAFARGLPGRASIAWCSWAPAGRGRRWRTRSCRWEPATWPCWTPSRTAHDELADALAPRFDTARVLAVDLGDLDTFLAEADGLIHATPTGMAAHPGSAVPAELLAPGMWVAEVVYMPVETELLKEARERGCRTLDGAAMVALQAAGSFELFTGARPDRERMLRHVEELFAERRSKAA